MILISKEEANNVRKECPVAEIVRTMIQHSERHRYYLTEDEKPMEIIDRLRNQGTH